ncbi:MAG: hypothetical protein JWO22_4172 [Frankiales bacterium]|nr:hypothetical protein [Frankiales bacterium]
MKLVRPVLAVAVGAGLVLSGTAGAASKPKPACNLVTDAAGDATGFLVASSTPLPSDVNLDILSADVASDAKKVTAVIRTAAIGSDSTSPTGDIYYQNFAVDGTKYYLEALVTGTTGTLSYGDFSGTGGTRKNLGPADGVVDAAGKTVHVTVPVSAVGIKNGKSVIDGLDSLAQRYVNLAVVGITPTADEATSDKTYKTGTPSCVTPGK